MKNIKEVLEKTYNNPELRQNNVPLFIGNPGMGKTKIIEEFAREKGVNLVELITSQMNPFEISGIAMPDKDTKRMTYFNFDKLKEMKDGDILFFDELLNGNPIVLNACLTLLEQRRLVSGEKLPDIMIIAAANPQGAVLITPQIKERFVWYNVVFDPQMWKNYMLNRFNMPDEISSSLCNLIRDEDFKTNNFLTPRSIVKAVLSISKNCPTPYKPVLSDLLEKEVENITETPLVLNDKVTLSQYDKIKWIDSLREDASEYIFNNTCDEKDQSTEEEYFSITILPPAKGTKLQTINSFAEFKKITKAESRRMIENAPFLLHETKLSGLYKSETEVELSKSGILFESKALIDERFDIILNKVPFENVEKMLNLIDSVSNTFEAMKVFKGLGFSKHKRLGRTTHFKVTEKLRELGCSFTVKEHLD